MGFLSLLVDVCGSMLGFSSYNLLINSDGFCRYLVIISGYIISSHGMMVQQKQHFGIWVCLYSSLLRL